MVQIWSSVSHIPTAAAVLWRRCRKMEKTVVWNYREILFCLQLVFQFLQLATHLLLLPGKQPTTCQSLLLTNYPQSRSALLRVAKHWGCVLDHSLGFNLRSSWFCLSRVCFMSSRWLSSCLSCFSEERRTDTCWFCIFSSLWLRLRLWLSCSSRRPRFFTCPIGQERENTSVIFEITHLRAWAERSLSGTRGCHQPVCSLSLTGGARRQFKLRANR